ncbi:DUF3783 domain-containing protein [Clostridium sp. SYSU_GA19001]|uniref:DUF3783 domain-containing protein n=1 Tax=Clostridium caldaquaticum TaxID=2940653 RepID=UPI0020773F89|nr:DUF3783 domain-containing protein [Clostridium caldaquaticum]MCM8709638.1 DUF3783 domain-containing protein [Clostridium caldaquaticum]
MSNNKQMLVYGFNEDERFFLDKTIEEFKLPAYKIIEKSMANMTIRDILNGLKLDTYDKELPDEKVVIFNNFSDEELDKTVKAIRAYKNIKPILAIVTPNSINWEFESLLEHLIEEREQVKRYMHQKNLNLENS